MRNVRNLSKISFTMLSCLFLASCNDTLTYDYLIMHPNELETAYSACQIDNASSCEVIKQAAHDMSELIYEQASDPEKFGKSIITLQQQLQVMKKNSDVSRQAYDQQLKKLQIMYAVVASHGPE
jgi:hypothetical protein